MTEAKPSPLSLAILRALVYADLFEFPMRVEEIHRQLLLERATAQQVLVQLQTCPWLVARVEQSGALFHLRGRSALVIRRDAQERATDLLIEQHLTALRLVSSLPYVRMVAFSGGTSRKNSVNDDDLDLFIIAEEGRVWTVYALMVALARALGCRDVLCANYLVDRMHVTVPDGGDLFTGHELMALVPIQGGQWLQHMAEQNPWVRDLLPNASPQDGHHLWRDSAMERLVQRGTELGLWPSWWLMERASRWIFGRHIRAKSGEDGDLLLKPGIMKLHASDNRGKIVTRYRDALHTAGLLEPKIETLLGRRLRPRQEHSA